MLSDMFYFEMVLALAEKYHYDSFHAKNVDRLATTIFEQLSDLHQLGEEELYLLRHGALLHDIGLHIATKKHHKHAAYLLLNDQQLDDYPKKERQLLAVLVRNHRKDVKLGDEDLSRYGWEVMPKLISILRIADALDYFHRGEAVVADIRIEGSRCIFKVDGVNLDELHDQLKKKASFFKEAFGLKAVFTSGEKERTSSTEPLETEINEMDIDNRLPEYDSGIKEVKAENTTREGEPTKQLESNNTTEQQNKEKEPVAD
ncbi:MAG: HD domain-containing protein [Bacillota bacterium]